jgi:hypothetical protein
LAEAAKTLRSLGALESIECSVFAHSIDILSDLSFVLVVNFVLFI